MIETEAREWIETHFGVSRGTTIADLVAMVVAESTNQNLVAASTLPAIWSRHIIDSAQLLRLAPDRAGLWVDIGTGAGFPGMVIAALRDEPILLVEPRKRRAEFLAHAAGRLGLRNVTVAACKIERAAPVRASIISARAVASLDKLFDFAAAIADAETLWLLPKGQSATNELAQARQAWQGVFHVEQSLTDPDAAIIVATGVRPR